MNFNDTIRKYHQKNKILFNENSDCLLPLQSKLQACNKRVIVLWALDCAKEALKDFNEGCPYENKAKITIDLCENWAYGAVKMKHAKQAILDLHAQAKKTDDIVYQSYCHAIAQACSCVHTTKHALGLPLYELSALVFKHGVLDFTVHVTDKIKFYDNQLDYWRKNELNEDRRWAMLMKDKENKIS